MKSQLPTIPNLSCVFFICLLNSPQPPQPLCLQLQLSFQDKYVLLSTFEKAPTLCIFICSVHTLSLCHHSGLSCCSQKHSRCSDCLSQFIRYNLRVTFFFVQIGLSAAGGPSDVTHMSLSFSFQGNSRPKPPLRN